MYQQTSELSSSLSLGSAELAEVRAEGSRAGPLGSLVVFM